MTPDAALAVLQDLLQERGIPAWLGTFAANKEAVYNIFLAVEPWITDKNARQAPIWRCHCTGNYRAQHDPPCVYGQLLRAVGGAKEVKRQRDAAHEAATQENLTTLGRYSNWEKGGGCPYDTKGCTGAPNPWGIFSGCTMACDM